jgi:rod shape-determining protein MreD
MNGNVVKTISFFLLLLVQVLVFKNVVLFHTAFCFVYVLFLLTFPVETNPLLLMLMAFILGLGIDVFYDSVGLHAMASVFMVYVRAYWLSRITPQGGYDRNSVPTLAANGTQWFVVYALPLVFIHHSVLFFTEAGGALYFWFTLLKVVLSTVFTVVAIVLIQLFFARK